MESPSETQFRVLYREFLFRIVDLEILASRADIAGLLGQFAAILAALSLMFCQGSLRIFGSEAPSTATLIGAWADEHFLIATTMAVVGLFAVLSWDAALPNQKDVLVLAPLPVRNRTLFLAKLAAAGAALTLTVGALNVFTGVFYPLAIGLATGGLIDVVRSFVAYWFTMLAAAAFMFGWVLGIQAIAAQLLPRQYFLRLSAVLQALSFCLILAVYFLQPPLATPFALGDSENMRLALRLPSYWFLALFQQLNGTPHEALAPLAIRAWAGVALSIGGMLMALGLTYLRTLRKVVEEPDVEPGRRRAGLSAPIGDPLRKAIFEFCARTMIRSRQHRIVLAFYLGTGFAVASAYGRTLLYGFYDRPVEPWDEVNRPILAATVAIACFAIMGARVAFALPVTLNANWVFKQAVAREAPEYLAATRQVLLLLTVAPVVGLSLTLLIVIWPPWPVVGHTILLALLGLIIVDLCLYRFRKIPFTCSYLPGKAQIHVTAGAYMLVLVALADVAVELEVAGLRDPVRFAVMVGSVAALAGLLRWRTSKDMASSGAGLQFEEAPASPVLTLDIQPDGGIAPAGSARSPTRGPQGA